MACKFNSELVHFIYDEVGPEEKQTIKDHIESCSECKEELSLLSGTKELLYEWKEIEPSPEFRGLLNDNLKNCTQEEISSRIYFKDAFFSMIKTLSPGICGMVVTTIMVLVMATTVRFQALNPVSLIICGVFWSGIYSMIFDLAIKNGSYGGKIRMRRLLGLNLKLSVYYTFLALLTGLILMLSAPLPSGLYTISFLYSFIPLFISSHLLSRKISHNFTLHGLFLGIFYILLMGPALYIQCMGGSLTLYLFSIASSSAGAMAGGMCGAWLGGRIFHRNCRVGQS